MRKKLSICLVLMLAFLTGLAFAADAKLINAQIVTEVLDWGETITGVRLEYSEEVSGASIIQNGENPGKLTYLVTGEHDIDAVYVNNSGKKGEAEPNGKYVFLDFCLEGSNWINYRDYVTFNTTAKTRQQSEAIYVYQAEPIATVSGETIAPSGRTKTSGEIRIGIDEYSSFLYESDLLDDGVVFYYHLYIPEGYEQKDDSLENLPIILHFPSGDVTYEDYSGLYYGALFTHNDATEWVLDDAQAENPCFVLTYGGNTRVRWHGDIYVDIVNTLLDQYNIDPSRIYGIGLAAGSNTMWETAFDHPDLFAGMLSVSFEFSKVYGEEDAAAKAGQLFDIAPTWVFVAEDDYSATAQQPQNNLPKGPLVRTQVSELEEMGYNIDFADGNDMWNGLYRGKKADKQAQEQIDRAEASGADAIVTLFLANTVRQTGHWVWTSVYTNATVRDWLFSQVNDVPYIPAK